MILFNIKTLFATSATDVLNVIYSLLNQMVFFVKKHTQAVVYISNTVNMLIALLVLLLFVVIRKLSWHFSRYNTEEVHTKRTFKWLTGQC